MHVAPGDTWARLESEARGHCCFCFSKGLSATHFLTVQTLILNKISRNTDEIKY